MNTKEEKPLLVMAHARCFDGAAAAWVFWRRFPDAEIHFVQYGDPVPVDVTDRVVVVVDFCFDLDTTIELIQKARSYTMLDHHPLARKVVQGVTDWVHKVAFPISASMKADDGNECSFECDGVPGKWGTFHVQWIEDQSGAMQAWNFCYTESGKGSTFGANGLRMLPPDLIVYHDDYDRWERKNPKTDAYIAGLGKYPLSLDTFKKLFPNGRNPNLGADALVEEGAPFVEYRNGLINSIIKETKHYLKVRGPDGNIYTVPVANAPKQLISYVSDALNHETPNPPFSLVYYDTKKGRVYRFGSSKTAMDVTPIAEFWGGGGHAHASGTIHNKRANLFTPWNGFVQRFKRFFKLDMRK